MLINKIVKPYKKYSILSNGKKRLTIRGMSPPIVNDIPEAKAACIGFALFISFNHNLSLICAPNASFSVSSFATINAVSFLSPLLS